jgi:kumamolisin
MVAEADPTERLKITVHLKTPYEDAEGTIDVTDIREMEHRRAALAESNTAKFHTAAQILRVFADRHGLVMDPDLEFRCVHLEGTTGQLCELFGTHLSLHDDGHQRFRARAGYLSIPAEIAPWTHSVLGLDERPLLQRPLSSFAASAVGQGMWPTEIAELYGISTEMDARGECIAVLAVGGSFSDSDLATARSNMHRSSTSNVTRCYVQGGPNDYPGVDTELTLDLQVLAGIVPSARIVVYFSSNNERYLAQTVKAILQDGTNQPHVLSISYGGMEGIKFTEQGCRTLDGIFQTAGKYGVTVVAAAGDGLATCGQTGSAHAMFPASSSYVLACGGTQIVLAPDGKTISDERVWNQESTCTGTGGGVSDLFDVPPYQQTLTLPASCNDGKVRRSLPDVSALASQSPGYKIVLNGNVTVEDGTSAAAPLWAALIAIANAKRGSSLGSIHDFLYRNPQLFRPITEGDNRWSGIGYFAGPGWNACTGWGVPKGVEMINGLSQMP